ARALDAKGAELDRAEQWVNLPRPPAEIEVLPEPGEGGRVAAVRLVLHSLTQEQPSALSATFDGRALPLRGGRGTLPAAPARRRRPPADDRGALPVRARGPAGPDPRPLRRDLDRPHRGAGAAQEGGATASAGRPARLVHGRRAGARRQCRRGGPRGAPRGAR